MRPPAFLCVFGALSLLACGSAEPPPVRKPPPAPVVAPEPGPKDGISRSVVDRAIKAGLGHFLAYVDIDAALDEKRHFVGWKILELRGPDGTWQGVDLQVGDIVTSVNGFKIERDYEADKAFKSLAVASEIRVSLIRDGKPSELRLAIVEDAELPANGSATVIQGTPEP
jgi:S1-C subfamily serine protease